MAQFFQQAQIEDNTKGYPIGDNFKNFIGALSRDELRSIQERRFALLMEKRGITLSINGAGKVWD